MWSLWFSMQIEIKLRWQTCIYKRNEDTWYARWMSYAKQRDWVSASYLESCILQIVRAASKESVLILNGWLVCWTYDFFLMQWSLHALRMKVSIGQHYGNGRVTGSTWWGLIFCFSNHFWNCRKICSCRITGVQLSSQNWAMIPTDISILQINLLPLMLRKRYRHCASQQAILVD